MQSCFFLFYYCLKVKERLLVQHSTQQPHDNENDEGKLSNSGNDMILDIPSMIHDIRSSNVRTPQNDKQALLIDSTERESKLLLAKQ